MEGKLFNQDIITDARMAETAGDSKKGLLLILMAL